MVVSTAQDEDAPVSRDIIPDQAGGCPISRNLGRGIDFLGLKPFAFGHDDLIDLAHDLGIDLPVASIGHPKLGYQFDAIRQMRGQSDPRLDFTDFAAPLQTKRDARSDSYIQLADLRA